MENFCLQNIYSHLGDDESRFLFENRLCYSLTGDLLRMVHNINARILPLLKSDKKIFIFGAGTCGHGVVSTFPEVCWHAFIDNDIAKIGKQGVLPIISFQEFIKNSENSIVLIPSPLYAAEMKQQLLSNGFPENSIIPYNASWSTQYFDLPYFKPQDNEFFVDAGGHNGSSTKDFFKWLGNFCGRSIIFEPDPILGSECRKNLENFNNVKIMNKALWNKNETLKFYKMGDGGNHIGTDGEEIIEAVSLDEELKDEREPVTFIKMDIEGAELNALKGAERIIKKYKPKLAICIYHKPEDVWEIPNLLLEFVPDYKFYIRHYTSTCFETVLYALNNPTMSTFICANTLN